MSEIYPYFIKFHIVFSVIFLVTVILISAYYLRGWLGNAEYGLRENFLRKLFLAMLYTDMILGIILYFFLQKPAELISAEEAMNYSKLRFWAIQHFSNIVFVTILCITGNQLILRTEVALKKFKYSFIYFGVSSLVIIVSVALFALRK